MHCSRHSPTLPRGLGIASVTVATFCALTFAPAAARAQWAVVTERLEGTQSEATIARIHNSTGHALEFYRDGAGAIRARFSLNAGITTLAKGSCPTLQVDRWSPMNRSVNDAACLATPRWAEYVLGHVTDRQVKSERLLQIMNGSLLTFRFRLDGGDYRDAQFSLAGSKRSLSAALGTDVVVTAR
ncbi:MAG: hypothetical protein HYR49_10640 [Gammaproteobacteria bacterium]|nr:hypothetical protein [Gammaproteobacteria bacterium]